MNLTEEQVQKIKSEIMRTIVRLEANKFSYVESRAFIDTLLKLLEEKKTKRINEQDIELS
jgi:hypothetical protein